ncbi:hypothetical protein HZH66_011785 [Vespula vulgaris]|uniref:Uncharacterized protein n=1 Tax=Vespula vulgaris TaxID=7454 RepID=A0A834JD15_VESVU|nr:hypothetical protein HZH66_011785 [Vespula vulgaris]
MVGRDEGDPRRIGCMTQYLAYRCWETFDGNDPVEFASRRRTRGREQTPTGREIIGSDLRTALLSRAEVFRTKFIPRREAHGSRGPSSWRPQLRRRLRY